MRTHGVRGLLIYCADYRCSHSIAISGDALMSGCPILRSASPVWSAASAVQMCGLTSTGTGSRDPGPEEQDKIGRQLQKIDTALHLLDDNVPAGISTDDEKRYGPSA
jgi:hypothetical protein